MKRFTSVKIMSKQQKQSVPVAKKVMPPSIPAEFRHSGSSFGSSTGYASSDDAVFMLTPDMHQREEQNEINVKSSLQQQMFMYPASSNQKSMVYYQQHSLIQSEDQGIDLTRSPGRESPGSSSESAVSVTGSGSGSGSMSGSRHSTASLDSGRASYHHQYHHSYHHHNQNHQTHLQQQQQHHHQLHHQNYAYQIPQQNQIIHNYDNRSTGSTSMQTTCSSVTGSGSFSGRAISSPSSANSPRCSLSSCSISSASESSRLEKMILQAIPDDEIIQTWLMDLQFEEYTVLFLSAGYDIQTICRMTPEDLTAIGIQNPTHRKKLKSEIMSLALPDNLPDYVPASIKEWLCMLKLEEYERTLKEQGYNNVEEVTQLTWEDLEDIGIVKLGHQKKIMLAIKRVKDIKNGKRFSCFVNNSPLRPYAQEYNVNNGRGKSLESLNEPIRDMSGITPQKCMQSLGHGSWQQHQYSQHQEQQRSYEESDLASATSEPISATVTFEMSTSGVCGGTLPRPRGLVKPRPIAKISANKSHVLFENSTKQQPYIDVFLDKKPTVPVLTQFQSQSEPPPQPQPQRVNEKITVAEIHQEPQPIRKEFSKQKLQQQVFLKSLSSSLSSSQSSSLPLPAYPSTESLSLIALDSQVIHSSSYHNDDLSSFKQVPPPPPAPSTPPNCTLVGGNDNLNSHPWNLEDKEIMATLLNQHRNNGSDASFKSSSSAESDSLPFANDNAGTIKNRNNQSRPSSAIDFVSSGSKSSTLKRIYQNHSSSFDSSCSMVNSNNESVDVLNDIGNMLANLTDELDAMLEIEKNTTC